MGYLGGQKAVDKPSDISNVRLVEVKKHDNDHWGGPTPAVAEEGPQWGLNGASKPSPRTTGAVPPAAEAPVAPKPCAADGVIRAEHPQWGVSDDKKPAGVEEPSVIKSRLSVHTRQHEDDLGISVGFRWQPSRSECCGCPGSSRRPVGRYPHHSKARAKDTRPERR